MRSEFDLYPHVSRPNRVATERRDIVWEEYQDYRRLQREHEEAVRRRFRAKKTLSKLLSVFW